VRIRKVIRGKSKERPSITAWRQYVGDRGQRMLLSVTPYSTREQTLIDPASNQLFVAPSPFSVASLERVKNFDDIAIPGADSAFGLEGVSQIDGRRTHFFTAMGSVDSYRFLVECSGEESVWTWDDVIKNCSSLISNIPSASIN
jgi:hypothetical protein